MNNPRQGEIKKLQEWKLVGAAMGIEVGANGTRHVQGAIWLGQDGRMRRSQLRAFLPRAHWEPMSTKATWEDQRKYCCNPEKEGHECVLRDDGHGSKQGARVDLDKFRDDIIAGMTDKDVCLQHINIFAKYRNLADSIRKIFAKDVEPLDENIFDKKMGLWIWSSESDMGKTTRLHKYCDDYYLKSQNKWWDGYEGQKTVFIDDPSAGWAPMLWGWMKTWIGLIPFTGEVKGLRGGVKVRFHRMVVAANFSAEEYFGEEFVYSHFHSRFVQVEVTTQQQVVKIYKDLFEEPVDLTLSVNERQQAESGAG